MLEDKKQTSLFLFVFFYLCATQISLLTLLVISVRIWIENIIPFIKTLFLNGQTGIVHNVQMCDVTISHFVHLLYLI